MLKFTDLVLGKKYRNKSNKKTYTLVDIGPHTEREEEAIAYYKDSEGFPWFRPLGLFMIKFENLNEQKSTSGPGSKMFREIVELLCSKKFHYTPEMAKHIVNEYSAVLDLIDIPDEEVAEQIHYAYINKMSSDTWLQSINDVEEAIAKMKEKE